MPPKLNYGLPVTFRSDFLLDLDKGLVMGTVMAQVLRNLYFIREQMLSVIKLGLLSAFLLNDIELNQAN